MEAQDKITEKFKEAARKIEAGGTFPGMDKVWSKVEERLEEQQERKVLPLRKWSIAAALLLLVGTSGLYLLFRDRQVTGMQLPGTLSGTLKPVEKKQLLKPAEEQGAPEWAISPVPLQSRQEIYKRIPAAQNGAGYHKEAAASPVVAQVTNAGQPEAESQKAIKGKIVDEHGEPIPGATVRIKGTTRGTLTDVDGNFELRATVAQELEINAYGAAMTLSLDHYRATQPIRMSPASYALQEVEIVTPYGPPASKEKFTGAADVINAGRAEKMPSPNPSKIAQNMNPGYQSGSSLQAGTLSLQDNQNMATPRHMLLPDPALPNNYAAYQSSQSYKWNRYNNGFTATPSSNQPASERKTPAQPAVASSYNARQINTMPVSDLTKAIEGAAPGVQATSGSGQPVRLDSVSAVRLRSLSTLNTAAPPLFVVDGIPVEGDISKLDPSEIDNVTVLKDATAMALYGSKAVNGAIIVTTKKAKTLKETQLSGTKEKGSFIKKGFGKVKNIFKKRPQRKTGMVLPQAAAPRVAMEDAARIKVDDESYESFAENSFENPFTEPLSTFSIDVDNASYTNIRRFINNGQQVPRDAVRVEEMVNFFHYKYPQPLDQHPFSLNTEYSGAPWNAKHQLLRIGLQGKILPAEQLPASNLVFLIDVSGSMNQPNKLPLLQASLKMLTGKLRAQDKVSIVVYAGSAGLVLPPTSGADKEKICEALDRLHSGGSTAGGQGIELAYRIAQEHFITGGNNRVILATDGDFNVGASSDADMQTLIEQKRKSNIFLTCLGYGMGNYKDSKMELLADKGNGNYAYIDNLQEANRFLVKEFGGTLFSIAKDVKIQIEFNPEYVQSYRLIGYENRKLRSEDFANDTIDAGELGSGHTVTALYEIIPAGVKSDYFQDKAPQQGLKYTRAAAAGFVYKNELATIKFRYKKPQEDKSTEMVQVINRRPEKLSSSSADFKFAAAVAWFGLKLRNSKLVPDMARDHILQLAMEGTADDRDGYRAEFARLVEAVQ